MPLISTVIGKVDFSDMILQIGNASIKYGNFITEIINFLIIAFSFLHSLKKGICNTLIANRNYRNRTCILCLRNIYSAVELSPEISGTLSPYDIPL